MSSQSSSHNSPDWGRNTKLVVSVFGLIVLILAVLRFSNLVRFVVIAGIIAYLLTPIIELVADRTPLKRGQAILLSYFIFLTLLIWAAVTIGVAGFSEVTSLIENFPATLIKALELLDSLSQRTFTVFGLTLDLSTVKWEEIGTELLEQAQSVVGTLLRRGGSFVGGAAIAAVSGLTIIANFFLIFVMSIYISQDVPRLGYMVAEWAELPGYQADAERLWRSFGRIWRIYLRGQVILAIVMWLIVWITLAFAGVSNAFALGLLSGVLEFLPIIGPLIAGGVAVIVALFQPDNWLGLPFWQYGLIVLAIMLILQQLENSILVPRIVGKSLDLHPLVTMLAVFVGASVAGVLGAILAAPLAATLKLLGGYAWRKLFDQPPFAKPEVFDAAEKASAFTVILDWLKTQLRKRSKVKKGKGGKRPKRKK